MGAAWSSGPCPWTGEVQPEAWGREERWLLLPAICPQLGLTGEGLPPVPPEPPVPFLAGLAPRFPLPGAHPGFKHPPQPLGVRAGAMEGVRHHSPLTASCLPLPPHLPPQNQLHHMRHQQYPALVWDPLCPIYLVPGPQPWGEGASWGAWVSGGALLWNGIPASPSHTRPW